MRVLLLLLSTCMLIQARVHRVLSTRASLRKAVVLETVDTCESVANGKSPGQTCEKCLYSQTGVGQPCRWDMFSAKCGGPPTALVRSALSPSVGEERYTAHVKAKCSLANHNSDRVQFYKLKVHWADSLYGGDSLIGGGGDSFDKEVQDIKMIPFSDVTMRSAFGKDAGRREVNVKLRVLDKCNTIPGNTGIVDVYDPTDSSFYYTIHLDKATHHVRMVHSTKGFIEGHYNAPLGSTNPNQKYGSGTTWLMRGLIRKKGYCQWKEVTSKGEEVTGVPFADVLALLGLQPSPSLTSIDVLEEKLTAQKFAKRLVQAVREANQGRMSMMVNSGEDLPSMDDFPPHPEAPLENPSV